MQSGREYFREIQKFTTSQYWNSGMRITAGVMIPMFVMIYSGFLTEGIPFLLGALFVSLTDTPGPIHHRRNGMVAAILLNTFVVFVTASTRIYEPVMIVQVLLFSLVLALAGIYGARAGAVGTLAIIIMLINMSPYREAEPWVSALLTGAGGVWYAVFSILLYRLQPYRLVEQALGEHLLLIASYLRSRGAFYRSGADIEEVFNRVMKDQVEVLRTKDQVRDLLFRTRQFLGDASPRSRSLMMIFLESLDIFEETMYSYQDYHLLHQNAPENVLNRFYGAILLITAEFEHIGLQVQAGNAVKKMPALEREMEQLHKEVAAHKAQATSPEQTASLIALEKTIENLAGIVRRLTNIVLYTRNELKVSDRHGIDERVGEAEAPKFTFNVLAENLTLRSNNFRYALRIVIALAAGYAISTAFALSHAYWVMLTIITIMKPVYNLTRIRNIQRVVGTLGGVLIAAGLLYLIDNDAALVGLMVFCMLIAYSLLRVNYLGFVTFLTIYLLITFHFLNPVEFRSLIGERLIDTVIGSVIAAITARFIFPLWQHENIDEQLKKMLMSANVYFLATWNKFRPGSSGTAGYRTARNEAIVSLTNVSDSFQQMLAEPADTAYASYIHQFVITSHTLISRISALSQKDFDRMAADETARLCGGISDLLQNAVAILDKVRRDTATPAIDATHDPVHPLHMIHGLAAEACRVVARIRS